MPGSILLRLLVPQQEILCKTPSDANVKPTSCNQVPALETLINTPTSLLLCLLTCLLAGCASTDLSSNTAGPVTDQTFGRYHERLEPGLIVITMTPQQQAQLTNMIPVPLGVELPPRYASFLDRLNRRYGLKRVANWPLATIDVCCVVFEVDNPAIRNSVVAALRQESGVETAQVVQAFDSLTANTPYDDPFLALQHGIHSLQAVRSHQWSRGKGVNVAVIDTGLDNLHPDLMSSSQLLRNFVDNDDTAFRADTHGTAVGGVIAADTGNATGMVGIAPDATLLVLKACWEIDDDARKARCNSLTLAKALNYSIQEAVDVINLSLTGPPDPLLERLVLQALAQNIVVVGATPLHDEAAFPVSIAGTIAVTMPDTDSPSLSAPGRRVLSTRPDEQYDFFNGSSFSTAHISGLAALIRSLAPTLSPPELHQLIRLTADEKAGEVNACRAVRQARRMVSDQPVSGSCERSAMIEHDIGSPTR